MRVQGSAGRCIWPDPCLEPEMLARCHVCRVGQRCPASVTLPWCGHSGVNAIFCTLFNGSVKIRPPSCCTVWTHNGLAFHSKELQITRIVRCRSHAETAGFCQARSEGAESAGTCMPDSGRFGLLPPPSAEAPIYSVMIHPFFMSARAGTIAVQPSRRDDP